MEWVVRDVVHGADDPAALAEVKDVDARRRLLEVAEVRPAPGERVRDQDPVDAAVQNCERRPPIAFDETVERRHDAVECFAERFPTEKACVLVARVQRADEDLLQRVGVHILEASAAPLRELAPLLELMARRDHTRRLDGAWKRARHDAVERHVGERPLRCGGLLEPSFGEVHDLRVSLTDVGDLGVAHQVEPSPHVRSIAGMSERSPLIVPERVEAFLDAEGVGSGPVAATRIGDGGGSNFTYLIERGNDRFVLRRPPRPPLPPSAHDMVREASLQTAIRAAGFTRLADIVAVCADVTVLGVPFYVTRFIDGHVVTQSLPAGLETATARRALGLDLVDTLVEIHAADVDLPELRAFARPGSYLERQVRRFAQLWEINRTREIPAVDEVGRYLTAALPEPFPATVVHGDYRLGNMMVAPDDPTRIVAVLDWEMGAIGDPRADVGYLLATYSEPEGRVSALGSSPVTATAGFPARAEIVERYREGSGRDVEPLPWFEALALWKAAVFCEAIYGRYIRGELGREDTRAAMFEAGVPLLAETALRIVS